jgi:hypothetical protein
VALAPLLYPVAAFVQALVDTITPAVEALVDPVTAIFQPVGGGVMALLARMPGTRVQTVFNPIAAIVQALIDTVAAFVQPLIHSAVVGHRPGTQQQTATQNARFQNYGFHDAPRFCVFVTAVNACPQTGLTLIRAILQKPDAVHK